MAKNWKQFVKNKPISNPENQKAEISDFVSKNSELNQLIQERASLEKDMNRWVNPNDAKPVDKRYEHQVIPISQKKKIEKKWQDARRSLLEKKKLLKKNEKSKTVSNKKEKSKPELIQKLNKLKSTKIEEFSKPKFVNRNEEKKLGKTEDKRTVSKRKSEPIFSRDKILTKKQEPLDRKLKKIETEFTRGLKKHIPKLKIIEKGWDTVKNKSDELKNLYDKLDKAKKQLGDDAFSDVEGLDKIKKITDKIDAIDNKKKKITEIKDNFDKKSKINKEEFKEKLREKANNITKKYKEKTVEKLISDVTKLKIAEKKEEKLKELLAEKKKIQALFDQVKQFKSTMGMGKETEEKSKFAQQKEEEQKKQKQEEDLKKQKEEEQKKQKTAERHQDKKREEREEQRKREERNEKKREERKSKKNDKFS